MNFKKSEFDGGILELIGINIVAFLISAPTLGIAAPWAVTLKHSWIKKHTIIKGRRLKFTGTGGSLFFNYIKWWFLTIITFGIYGFWLEIKMEEWKAKNTTFDI